VDQILHQIQSQLRQTLTDFHKFFHCALGPILTIYCKFTRESSSERCLKIGSLLTELLLWVGVQFFGPPCNNYVSLHCTADLRKILIRITWHRSFSIALQIAANWNSRRAILRIQCQPTPWLKSAIFACVGERFCVNLISPSSSVNDRDHFCVYSGSITIDQYHASATIMRRFVFLLWCPKGRFVNRTRVGGGAGRNTHIHRVTVT